MQLIQNGIAPEWSIRPLEPADRVALAEGFHRLSAETRRRRYLGIRSELTEEELDVLTGRRADVAPALAAVGAGGDLIAVGRAGPEPGDPETVHIGVVVADCWQGHGVGSALLAALADRERSRGVRHLRASTLADNAPVKHMLRSAGAYDWHSLGDGVIEATVDLPPVATGVHAA